MEYPHRARLHKMALAGPKAVIIEHSIDGSDWVEQDLFVEKNSFNLHLNRIYILRDGLDPDQEHTLSVRISVKRNETSQGNHCRSVYFGLSGDRRTPKGVEVDGVYSDSSMGYGPEKWELKLFDRSRQPQYLLRAPALETGLTGRKS